MEIEKYDTTFKLLHWFSALVILWACVSGFYAVFGNAKDSITEFITSFNISLTTTFIPVFIIRVYCRIKRRKRILKNGALSIGPTANFIHFLIYILITVVLLSGVLMMRNDIEVFGLISFPSVLQEQTLTEFFSCIHRYSTMALFALVLLHILAVAKHEIRGKRILKRML